MNAESFSSPTTSRLGSNRTHQPATTCEGEAQQTDSGLPLSHYYPNFLERAEAVLGQEDISSSERQVRLEIVEPL